MGIAVLVAVDAIQLITPRLLGQIIDRLKQSPVEMPVIRTYIYWILALAFGLVIGRFLWRAMIIGAARIFEFHTVNHLFRHIIALDQNFFDHWRSGDLMTRFTSDTDSVVRMIGFGVIMMVDVIILTSLTVISMGELISWELTLKCIIPLPLIALVSLLFGRRIYARYQKLQNLTSELSNLTEESIVGIQVIKLFANQTTQHRMYNQKSAEVYAAEMKLVKTWGILFPLIHFFGAFSSLLVFYFGGRMVIEQKISLGEFVTTNSYVALLVWPMMALGWLVNLIQSGRASLKRLHEVLNQQPVIMESEISEAPLQILSDLGGFQIRNLDFTYPDSQRQILRQISIDIPIGKTTALVGRVGCGKSTIAKLLVKLYPVEDGRIFFTGQDINQIQGSQIRDKVAYVPQDSFLFSASIRDNVAFSGIIAGDQAEEYALAANVYQDIIQFPQQFETVVGERGITLSGGQRQRLTIARALAKNAPIIILDDCLSSVDSETEVTIIRNLKKELMNKTILLISHRLKAVKDADIIYVLENGSVAEEGSHLQLMELKGLYSSMFMKQLIETKLETE